MLLAPFLRRRHLHSQAEGIAWAARVRAPEVRVFPALPETTRRQTFETTHHKEREVKKFVFLHFGFEKPTPKIMEAWMGWFKLISDKQVDQGGFSSGREISKSGTRDLPLDMESITGYNVIEAESLDAAEKLAQTNPFISSIRIYEVRSM